MNFHPCRLESLCTPLAGDFPIMHWAEGIEASQTDLKSITESGLHPGKRKIFFLLALYLSYGSIHFLSNNSTHNGHLHTARMWRHTFTTTEGTVQLRLEHRGGISEHWEEHFGCPLWRGCVGFDNSAFCPNITALQISPHIPLFLFNSSLWIIQIV